MTPQLKKLRAICLALPEATVVESGGNLVFCAGKHAFAKYEERAKTSHASVRTGTEDEAWIRLDLSRDVDWDEIKDLVLMGYVAVAPKKMLRRLDERLSAPLLAK